MIAHQNRNKVIVAGLFVEREIEAIIGFYLYPGTNVTEQHSFVASEVLGSDVVSFSQKKRLILSLVHRKDWLQGEAKSEFDKELKKVISYRNAFTHGDVIVRDSTAFIEYFEGTRKKPELTDAYWSDLESSFDAVVKRIEAVKVAAGMPGA